MASVLEIVMAGRSDVSQIERATRAQLLDAYEIAYRRVEFELARGEAFIQQLVDSGQHVDERWLRTQVWYQQLEESIEREMGIFQARARTVIANAQSGSLLAATSTATQIANPFRGRVHAPAFERWVSAMQPDTPIFKAINRYGTRARNVILQEITEGIGTGRGSSNITKIITRKLGPEMEEWRIARISRTETMRAYRGGFQDSMTGMVEQGIVTGYTWVSAHDRRTCLACLAMDGKEFDEYPELMHVQCRCVAAPRVREGLVPGGRPRMTGEEWLSAQDEVTQRAIMGSARYEAWKNGTPLDDMVGIRRDPVWGDSVTLKPIRDLEVARKAA